MEIITNMLIKWISEDDCEQQAPERVLHISPDGKEIILINVSAKNALPVRRFREDLELSYSVGDLRIIEADLYDQLPEPHDLIEEKYTKRRDKAWSLIQPLVEELGSAIYESSVRGKKIAEICKAQKSVEGEISEEKKSNEKEKPAKKVIYDCLRKYWQAGCNKNGLLPKYKKCGNKGSRKNKNKSSGKKLGRPTAVSRANEVQRGILITPHIEELFKKGAKKFYLTLDKYSFSEAYRQTIYKYFLIDTKTLPNGVEIPILPPADKLPSEDQFRYWYRRYYRNPDEEKKARSGETEYNLRHRPLYGNSTSMSFGPGSIYQIDATIADVYLVSSFFNEQSRHKIIGRPVVYLIVDVFSRMIVGFSVALEGPSWLGMMLALDNMVADKIAFCAEYGIPIEKWQWNCNSLPEAIIGDRGELESHAATIITDYLGVRIHNTAPYRGDLKGIVERNFGKANVETIQFIPGYVKKREHGEKDHRLDGTLTLHEFRALIIIHILRHNLNTELTDYPADQYLVADEIPHIPINLWNWGIENRSGYLHTKPRDFVRLGLMPRKEATINRKGIHFGHDVYYEPPSLPNIGQSRKVTISYDPRSMDYVYLPMPNGVAVTCPLTPASQLFLGRDLYDAEWLFNTQTQQKELNQTGQNQSDAFFRAHQKHIIKNAKTEKKLQSSGSDLSNAQKVADITGNRIKECNNERTDNAFLFGNTRGKKQLPPTANSNQINAESNKEQGYVSAPDYSDMIDSILDETLDGE